MRCCRIAEVGVTSLVNVKSLCIGVTGKKGQSQHCHGANADNTVIPVSFRMYV